MAKALFGHVGAGTTLVSRRRCTAFVPEYATSRSELDRALAVNELLASQVDVSDELRALDKEPALT